MKLVARIVLFVALAVAASPALAADVTGSWKAEFDTQVGVQKYTFDLKAEGAKLTGKASFERMGEKGEAVLLDGKIAGDDVSFVEKLNFQGNELPITYSGKLSGDEIRFTRKVGDFATEEFVAKRVKN